MSQSEALYTIAAMIADTNSSPMMMRPMMYIMNYSQKM